MFGITTSIIIIGGLVTHIQQREVMAYREEEGQQKIHHRHLLKDQMTDKEKDIAAGIMSIFVILVFFFGIYAWKHQPKELVVSGRKLYYVCIASVMYISSFITFMLSKVWWLKAISSSVASVFAVNLYQEWRIKEAVWSNLDYWFIVIICANYFFLYIIIDKLKR